MANPAQPLKYDLFIGASEGMQHVYRLISRVANASYPVLILGETGAGKELVARAIHQLARARRPFVPIDCSAVAPTLFETEMFGCVRGAYTGAFVDRIGMMEVAQNGTLFLDEIGNLPLELQAKLLRVLQQKEIRPVGSTRIKRFEARVLAATTPALIQGVTSGKFRPDLFYRLNVVQIIVPPLRRRVDDIEPLIRYIVDRICTAEGISRSVSPAAIARLKEYNWPGNVRELQNVVERTMAIEDGPVLEFGDFPSGHEPILEVGEQSETLAKMQKRMYLHVMQVTGDKKLAAKMLGVGKTTVYRRLKGYESEVERVPSS